MPRTRVRNSASAVALLALALTLLNSSRVARAQEPSGEDVINKYIEATGGRDAYAKVTSRAVTGTVSVPAQNISGKVSVWQKQPGLLLEVVEIAGVGKERRGYNAKTGIAWSSSDMAGVRLVKGDELTRLKQEADAQSELHWKDLYRDAKNAGVEKVEGTDCYKIEMTTKTGRKETRYYDKANGLLKRTVMDLELPQGMIAADATIGDYREVNGLKIPFSNSTKLSVSGIRLVQNVTLDKVETNVDIPDDKFAPPDDVKKLAEKEKAGGATTKGAK